MFKGSFVALVTPFTKEDSFDKLAFEKLVEWHIENGTHGLVPCGTTGESVNLSDDEHKEIVKTCIEISDKRVPVIAGTGSNSTAKTIKATKTAEELGADAALIVVPYYNKPSQEGLYQHFKKIHDTTNIPIILYNVPSRTVTDISVETVLRLSKLPRIVGIKDASPDLSRVLDIRDGLKRDDFCLLSGEDATIAAYLNQGGDGCISVSANIAPKLCAELHNAWQAGDLAEFNRLRDLLGPIHDISFAEPSPAVPKYVLAKANKLENLIRLPMLPVTDAIKSKIDNVVKAIGL